MHLPCCPVVVSVPLVRLHRVRDPGDLLGEADRPSAADTSTRDFASWLLSPCPPSTPLPSLCYPRIGAIGRRRREAGASFNRARLVQERLPASSSPGSSTVGLPHGRVIKYPFAPRLWRCCIPAPGWPSSSSFPKILAGVSNHIAPEPRTDQDWRVHAEQSRVLESWAPAPAFSKSTRGAGRSLVLAPSCWLRRAHAYA